MLEQGTPPWAKDENPAQDVEFSEKKPVEVIESMTDGGKLHKVRKPKEGSDVTNPETFTQIMAHAATHDVESVPKAMDIVEEVSISTNLRKRLAMPCPFVPPDEAGQRITSSDAVASVLLQKAVAGDMAAIREVLNRSEGKVPNVTHNESKSLKVSATTDGLVALFNELDKNK